MTRRLVWTSASHSHVGMVRTVNEDDCLDFGNIGLWAVADGMGGHEAGDVASQMIIAGLRQCEAPQDLPTFVEAVKRVLLDVNCQLRQESARHYHNRTIGSTVVVFLVHGEHAACLWVGDSRAYRLRDGQLEQLTRDHSHVQELVDQGLIKPADALHHPMGNIITRAVGSADGLDIDIVTFSLQVGDVYLLCTDGLNKVITDEEIARVLSSHNSQKSVRALIHSALVHGANDNVTTAVVAISEEISPHEERTLPTSQLLARQRTN